MSVLYGVLDEARPEEQMKRTAHAVVKFFAIGLVLWSTLPIFGLGVYKTSSGDLHFDLWYLMSFMVIAFFLMHELITPMPGRDEH